MSCSFDAFPKTSLMEDNRKGTFLIHISHAVWSICLTVDHSQVLAVKGVDVEAIAAAAINELSGERTSGPSSSSSSSSAQAFLQHKQHRQRQRQQQTAHRNGSNSRRGDGSNGLLPTSAAARLMEEARTNAGALGVVGSDSDDDTDTDDNDESSPPALISASSSLFSRWL